MREVLSEPQHWRSRHSANPSWSTRRRAATMDLSAELVDAAFTDEGPLAASRLDAAEGTGHAADGTGQVEAELDANPYPELSASLNDQLAQLEAQRRQLQKLLAETSDRQSS
jgi:hypothetical protein